MDFSKIKGNFYFNKKFLSSKEINISLLNHSLHFSGSVFEGIRVYSEKPFFLSQHIKRLINSCKLMKLDLKLNQNQIEIIIFKLIKINKIKNGYIRPLVFRDSKSMSPDTSNCNTLLFIAIWKWKLLFNKNKISLCTGNLRKANNLFYPIEAKSSGSYQSSIIEKIEANKKGFDDALLLDSKKKIAETTACNIFWVKDGVFYTPKTHSILNGITRQIVLKILKKKKVKFTEGDFTLSFLKKADEIFLTGTATEIIQVNKIDDERFEKNKFIKIIKDEFEKLKKL